jgi:Big-like domain-containing protein
MTVAAGSLIAGFAGSASAAGAPPWEPNASSVGGLTFFNAAGQQITGGNLTDSPIAAYVEGTSTIRAGDTKATLYGYLPVDGETPGQWSGESLGSSTTYPNASAPAPLNSATLPLETGASGDETVAQLEADFPNNDTSNDGYAGIYNLRLETSATAKPANLTYDSVDILISGSTWSVDYPTPTLTSTTTALATVPTSPQVFGTSVSLNATVSPSAPGTVQFENGSTPIGSPVTVVGGAASLSTSSLPEGTDTLNAVFTPAQFSAYSGSTGTTSFTVQAPPSAGTTTGLGVNPSTAAADTSVTITADVTNTATSAALSAGDGQVKFYDDGTDSSGDITNNSILLGTVSLGTGGIASLPYDSFAVGAHNLVGEFLPTNSATYSSSVSLPVLFTATTPTIAPDAQTVDVNIPAGSLVITTPYTPSNPFLLGTAVLDPTDSKYTASAAFGDAGDPSGGVSITDTRAGDQSWTASATVTDFSNGSSGVINGQNLTFTGVTPFYIAGNALQSGDVVTNDVTNSAIYSASASGSDGLKGGPHQFATAAAGEGSVYIGGLLTLTAPSSSPAGTYTATLTFTII